MKNILSINEFIYKDDLISEMYSKPYKSSLRSKNKYMTPDQTMSNLLYDFKKVKGLYVDLSRSNSNKWEFIIYNTGKYQGELLLDGTEGLLYKRLEDMMNLKSLDQKSKSMPGMKEMSGHLFEVKFDKGNKKYQKIIITLKKENYKVVDDTKTQVLQELNVELSQLIKSYSSKLKTLDPKTLKRLNWIIMDFRNSIDDLSDV